MGVTGGNKDITLEKVLEGDCKTGIQTNMGIMIISIAGNIMLCASLISLQAAPTAEKIEPKIISASNWNRRNQK